MVFSYLMILIIVCFYHSLMDIKYRQITNYGLLVTLVFQMQFFLHKGTFFLLSASIVLVIGFIIYLFGFLGAGDIKYATVLSLSLPMELLPQALLLTMLTGGVLAFIYLLLHLVRRAKAKVPQGIDEPQYNPGIPYGVAISVGFYVMILSHWVKYL